MKIIAALLLALATVTLGWAQSPRPGQSTGPEIIVDRAGLEIFPASWLTEKISATAEPLSAEAQPRGREIVDRALAKYPSAVLRGNLQKVYVLGGLKYSGVPAGGTRSRSAVYVVSKARYSAAQVENNFHAEFSSILLRNFPSYLDEAAWRRVNPPEFAYRGSGVQAIRVKQASLGLSDAAHKEGFLNEYAKASLEEDFNSYAARLFTGQAALWETMEKYPKVKTKAELTMAFYEKLEVSLSKEFFRSLRPAAAK